MILYKYRSLANLVHVFDIILNQRLHCSTYPELNDPFEGIFETTIPYWGLLRLCANTPARRRALVEGRKIYKKVEHLVRICSLSSDPNDVRLWSYYADGHRGIVFKIDFSGLEKIYEVKYSEKLPWSSTNTILGQLSPKEVLSRKTNHWGFESEYRIIDESKHLEEGKYFDIKGRIKAIYLGTRTSDIHRKLLNKILPSEIPIYTTKINEKAIKVESDELYPRT
jgi:hypothetical protein